MKLEREFGMNIVTLPEVKTSDAFSENFLLTYKKAAQWLNVSETTLRLWKSAGKIPWVPVGTRGVRFRTSSLKKWIEERELK